MAGARATWRAKSAVAATWGNRRGFNPWTPGISEETRVAAVHCPARSGRIRKRATGTRLPSSLSRSLAAVAAAVATGKRKTSHLEVEEGHHPGPQKGGRPRLAPTSGCTQRKPALKKREQGVVHGATEQPTRYLLPLFTPPCSPLPSPSFSSRLFSLLHLLLPPVNLSLSCTASEILFLPRCTRTTMLIVRLGF
jgi:hypothetical protein